MQADITPHVSLIQKMGQTGYNFWQALSELIDNALDARVPEEKTISIQIKFDPTGADWIEIRDDGAGMTKDILNKSLILAHVEGDKEKRLGKFGLGMKTACSSLGSKFTITTKPYPDKSDDVFKASYDEDKFIKGGKWNLEIEELCDKNFKHGTLIRIENLSKRGIKLYYQKIQKLIHMFELQYASFLRNGELKISIDTFQKRQPAAVLKSFDWDSRLDKDYGKKEFKFKIEGKEVKGWVGFLRSGTTGVSKGASGFNLFWRGRIVRPYMKIGYRYHAETWLLVGELHLDDFPVTHDKRDFSWDNEIMKKLVGPYDIETDTFEPKESRLHKEIESLLNEMFERKKQRRELNNLASIAKYSFDVPSDKVDKIVTEHSESKTNIITAKAAISKLIKEIEEERKSKKEKDFKESPEKFSFEGGELKFKLGDKLFISQVSEDNLGERGPQFRTVVKEEKVFVTINKNHPLFFITSDTSFYKDLMLIEAISHEIIKSKGAENSLTEFLLSKNALIEAYIKHKSRF